MRKLIALMVLSLFVYSVTKETVAGDIFGYVYDAYGKGLPRVKISSKDDRKVYSEETSGSGNYRLSLDAGNYTIRYEKEGYQTQANDVSLLKNEKKYIEMVVMVANPNSD